VPRFIGLDAALAMHQTQIEIFGGTQGLRDQGLLESALGQVQSTYAYTSDLYEAAAQYCLSLAKNHPFLDGNKRIAADYMLTFLVLNRIEPTFNSAQLFDWTMRIAMSEMDHTELAVLLRTHSKPMRGKK
jgi:death on curing protein